VSLPETEAGLTKGSLATNMFMCHTITMSFLSITSNYTKYIFILYSWEGAIVRGLIVQRVIVQGVIIVRGVIVLQPCMLLPISWLTRSSKTVLLGQNVDFVIVL